MSDEETPGLEALLECEEQVKITIRNYMKDIAGFLRKKNVGIIDLSLYTQVTDPRARESIDDRAQLVYQRLQAMVEQDEKKYYKLFVDFLRKSPQKYRKTVSMLDKAYADNGGVCDSATPVAATPVAATPVAAQPTPTPQATSAPAPSPPKPFVLEVPDDLPEKFSEDFSPMQFAQWMKGRNHLPDEDCKVIIDSGIGGLVFMDIDDENGLKDFGFVKSGFYALRAVWKKVKTKPDSIVAPPPTAQEPPESPAQDEESVASDGFNREKSARFPAMDRGTYKPQLKFKSNDDIAKLSPKQELIIPRLANGYYPMQAKKHGVCLIINNKTFKDSKHRERRGTDRDEHNLIETWRYLGYHVEVRREAKHREIMDIFYDIDDLLENINRKTKSQVTNDSFVCCILSHGNKFCFFSSDSKEVKIDYMERALGASEILRDKPKMFFIQACQGEGLGTAPVSSTLHADRSGLQADSEVQTSRRSDIYISYATAQGDQSYRHIEKGSWYIGTVCLTLCEESRQSAINELQHFINKGVSDNQANVFVTDIGEYRQQPSCSDQLRRNVHFFFESSTL